MQSWMGALEGMGLGVVEAQTILWFGSVEIGVVGGECCDGHGCISNGLADEDVCDGCGCERMALDVTVE